MVSELNIILGIRATGFEMCFLLSKFLISINLYVKRPVEHPVEHPIFSGLTAAQGSVRF